MAERVAARLGALIEARRTSPAITEVSRPHGVMMPRLASKRASFVRLVATASLELGIDIGDVDLVLQVGSCRSIATFLQRVGRAGHGVGRVPKGRLFPLTRDELVEAKAIVDLRCREAFSIERRNPVHRSTSWRSRSSPRA